MYFNLVIGLSVFNKVISNFIIVSCNNTSVIKEAYFPLSDSMRQCPQVSPSLYNTLTSLLSSPMCEILTLLNYTVTCTI